MIVHDIKHPTESLIKILDFLQEMLQPDVVEDVLNTIEDMSSLDSAHERSDSEELQIYDEDVEEGAR